MLRFGFKLLTILIFSLGMPPDARAALLIVYGGEDIVLGSPWHHEQITMNALYGRAGDASFSPYGEGPASPDARGLGVPLPGPSKRERRWEDGVDPGLYMPVGFTFEAASAVAWHADNLDSYLYNPLYWAQGGSDRTSAALAIHADLKKLHFDDLSDAEEIGWVWQRYVSGTLIGLDWAYQREDVDAAHHLLGVLLHAVQDFYSHTNWVDHPGFELTPYHGVQTDSPFLMAYTYEGTDFAQANHHGAISAPGIVLDKLPQGTRSSIETLCGWQYFMDSVACQMIRPCEINAFTHQEYIFGAAADITYCPRGHALDALRMAEHSTEQRGLTAERGRRFASAGRPIEEPTGMRHWLTGPTEREASGAVALGRPRRLGDEYPLGFPSDRIFASAKHLATLSSIQVVQYVGETFSGLSPDHARFWQDVKTLGSCNQSGLANWQLSPSRRAQPDCGRERQFEDLRAIPFTFLTAGPYPYKLGTSARRGQGMLLTYGEGARADDKGAWYLRVELEIPRKNDAGTDADVFAEAAGLRTLLDYNHVGRDGSNILYDSLFYVDDFEQGSRFAYVLGPFSNYPSELTLSTQFYDNVDIAEAVLHDITDFFADLTGDIVTLFSGLLGTGADYIGQHDLVLSRDDLDWIIDNDPASRKHETRRHLDGEVFAAFCADALPLTCEAGMINQRNGRGIPVRFGEGGFDTEGVYDLWLAAGRKKTAETGDLTIHTAWVQALGVVKESLRDGGTTSDEPFFFFTNVWPRQPLGYASRSDSDADTGERFNIDMLIGEGPLSEVDRIGIHVMGYESDLEAYIGDASRGDLFKAYRGVAEKNSADLMTVRRWGGAADSAPFELSSIDVYAFRRDKMAAGGRVYRSDGAVRFAPDVRDRLTLNLGKPPQTLSGAIAIGTGRAAIARAVAKGPLRTITDRQESDDLEGLTVWRSGDLELDLFTEARLGMSAMGLAFQRRSGSAVQDVIILRLVRDRDGVREYLGETASSRRLAPDSEPLSRPILLTVTEDRVELFKPPGPGPITDRDAAMRAAREAGPLTPSVGYAVFELGRTTANVYDRLLQTSPTMRPLGGGQRPSLLRRSDVAEAYEGTWSFRGGTLSLQNVDGWLIGSLRGLKGLPDADAAPVIALPTACAGEERLVDLAILTGRTSRRWRAYWRDGAVTLSPTCDDDTPQTILSSAKSSALYPAGLSWGTDRVGNDYASFSIAGKDNAHEAWRCSQRCANDARCQAYAATFENTGARCWLKDAVPPARPAPAHVVSGVAAARNTVAESGNAAFMLDIVGKQEGTSFAGCERACLENARCQAFLFDDDPSLPNGPRCTLSASMAETSSWRAGHHAQVAHVRGGSGVRTADASTFKIWHGIGYPGSDIGGRSVSSTLSGCRKMCAEDDSCKAFTYVDEADTGRGQCWKKFAVPTAKLQTGRTSGVKGAAMRMSTVPDLALAATGMQRAPGRLDTPAACRRGCSGDVACRGYTYVPRRLTWQRSGASVPISNGCYHFAGLLPSDAITTRGAQSGYKDAYKRLLAAPDGASSEPGIGRID